jgi:phosphate uptake regulator
MSEILQKTRRQMSPTLQALLLEERKKLQAEIRELDKKIANLEAQEALEKRGFVFVTR